MNGRATGGQMLEVEEDRVCKSGQRDCRLTTAIGRSCSVCRLCLCRWKRACCLV